jgi:hypothetical protein
LFELKFWSSLATDVFWSVLHFGQYLEYFSLSSLIILTTAILQFLHFQWFWPNHNSTIIVNLKIKPFTLEWPVLSLTNRSTVLPIVATKTSDPLFQTIQNLGHFFSHSLPPSFLKSLIHFLFYFICRSSSLSEIFRQFDCL